MEFSLTVHILFETGTLLINMNQRRSEEFELESPIDNGSRTSIHLANRDDALPPMDGGKHAWLFIVAATCLEVSNCCAATERS